MRLGLVRAVVPKAEGVGWMRGLGAGVPFPVPCRYLVLARPGASPRVGRYRWVAQWYFQRGGVPDAAFGLIRATRLARRHAWALPLGCVMDISSVAGPRMRPLALSGLRGWRVAARWALPLGCAMGISSVAGPRMRPLALSGLRGWRVATRWALPLGCAMGISSVAGPRM